MFKGSAADARTTSSLPGCACNSAFSVSLVARYERLQSESEEEKEEKEEKAETGRKICSGWEESQASTFKRTFEEQARHGKSHFWVRTKKGPSATLFYRRKSILGFTHAVSRPRLWEPSGGEAIRPKHPQGGVHEFSYHHSNRGLRISPFYA